MRPAHLLDIDDLSNQDIEHILATAEEFRGGILPKRLAAEHVMGMHFQEPSVRTRFGFMAAISRLGGAAIDMPAPYQEPQMSSRETLGDVVRSVGGYVHLIVARCATVEALSEMTIRPCQSSTPVQAELSILRKP